MWLYSIAQADQIESLLLKTILPWLVVDESCFGDAVGKAVGSLLSCAHSVGMLLGWSSIY